MRHLTDTVTLFERHDWKARPWRRFNGQRLNGEAFIHHGAEHDSERLDHFEEQALAMRAVQNQHMDAGIGGVLASDIAYHFMIFQPHGDIPYARIFEGRPVSHVPAAQLNHNAGTIAICVYGNFDHEDSLHRNTRFCIEVLCAHYPALKTLGGHRDVVNTECPGDTLYKAIPLIARAANLARYRK